MAAVVVILLEKMCFDCSCSFIADQKTKVVHRYMEKYNLIVSSTNKIKTMEKIMTSILSVIKLLIHFTEFAVFLTGTLNSRYLKH